LRHKPVTRAIYGPLAASFRARHQVHERSPASAVDEALDGELRSLFASGEGLAEMRQLLHAVQSSLVRTKAELRLSHATVAGAAADSPPHIEEPESWEATLLQCRALLKWSNVCTPQKRALAVTAWLLAFDLYWRGGVWVTLRVADLMAPTRHQQGTASYWSITQFPSTRRATSKTRQHDLTGAIGSTNDSRRWLQQLCPLLRDFPRPRGDVRLFPLSVDEVQAMLADSRRLASLPPTALHRLRHGGASADGIAGVADSIMLERGAWSSLKSLMRYRRPARYLRQLALLKAHQLEAAQACPAQILGELMVGLK